MRKVAAAAAFALSASACSGATPGIQGQNFASAVVGYPTGSSASGLLTILLPSIATPGAQIPWSSKPQLLSSQTRVAALWIAKKMYGPFPLSASAQGCTSTGSAFTCSITAQVTAGAAEQIRVETFRVYRKGALPLATGNLARNIYAGDHTTYAMPMFGVAKTLGVITRDRQFTYEEAVAEPIIAVGIDVDGRVIPSTKVVDPHGSPLPGVSVTYTGFDNGTLTSGFTSGSNTVFSCCGVLPPAFEYDGTSTGRETFLISGQGIRTSRSATLTVGPQNTTPATLIASTGALNGPPLIVQYPLSGTGDISPTRAFSPAIHSEAYSLYGEDAAGNFWSGETQYSNTGEVLGALSLPPTVQPFARDATGNLYANGSGPACSIAEYSVANYVATPAREVDYACEASFAATVDANGNIYVSLNSYAPNQPPAQIEEFPAGASAGSVSPSRVITMPSAAPGTYYETSAMDADAAGNVYVAIDYANASGNTYHVFKLAPGATTLTDVLPGVPIRTMAVDDAGDIYARTYIENELNAIEVFPAGSTTPSQTISGSNSQLSYVGQLTVPRAWNAVSMRRSQR